MTAGVLLLMLACSHEGEPESDAPPSASHPTQLTAEVGVDDVSFLYPLPELRLRLSLLGANETGPRGPLLPQEVVRSLPPLDTLQTNDDLYYLFRVLSVRIDPCFPGLGVKEERDCKNQIRLVMQPVVLEVRGAGLTTMDLALHLFYTLGRDELAGFLQELTDLRAAAGIARADGPVGVHRALAKEGIEGPFAKAFRTLLLDHAGKDNLTRVTFMGVEQVGQIWRFGGFDLDGGKATAMSIPLVNVNEQIFQNRDLDGATFTAAGTSPPSPSEDDIRLLFDPVALASATDDARRAAYRHALRIENPKTSSPETIDCATCHVAMAARRFVEKTYGLSADGVPERYVHPRGMPLDGATVARTNELRAFGYLDARPSISQRTVNETAEVVLHVNTIVRRTP